MLFTWIAGLRQKHGFCGAFVLGFGAREVESFGLSLWVARLGVEGLSGLAPEPNASAGGSSSRPESTHTLGLRAPDQHPSTLSSAVWGLRFRMGVLAWQALNPQTLSLNAALH